VATAAELSELFGRLRRALTTADGGALGALLAEEVEWLGARGGACHGRGEVLASAGEPVDPRRQTVLFYLYTTLPGGAPTCSVRGIPAGEMLDGSPGLRQKMRVTDRDGYCLPDRGA